jgi:hypothetical protein
MRICRKSPTHGTANTAVASLVRGLVETPPRELVTVELVARVQVVLRGLDTWGIVDAAGDAALSCQPARAHANVEAGKRSVRDTQGWPLSVTAKPGLRGKNRRRTRFLASAHERSHRDGAMAGKSRFHGYFWPAPNGQQ